MISTFFIDCHPFREFHEKNVRKTCPILLKKRKADNVFPGDMDFLQDMYTIGNLKQ